MAATLSPGGIDGWDALILACFALTLPWTAIGFWNALIGLVILRRQPPMASFEGAVGPAPIQGRTALLSCIRNEDTSAVGRNLDRMIAGILGQGQGERFEVVDPQRL